VLKREVSLFLCAICLIGIGCSRSPQLDEGNREDIGPDIIEQLKSVRTRVDSIVEKFKETKTPTIMETVAVEQCVKEFDVSEDAFSKLVPRTWNLVRLSEPEFFTAQTFNLSNWEDLKRKLSNCQYRLMAIDRYLAKARITDR